MMFLWLTIVGYFAMSHMALTVMGPTVEVLPGVFVSSDIFRPLATFMLATLGAALLRMMRDEDRPRPPDPKIPVATVYPNSALRWWVQR